MSRLWTSVLVAIAAIQLAPSSGTIGGTVIKAGTVIQQPLPNARLELRGGPETTGVARTDTSGRFVFSGLAPGEYRLVVTCDGYIRQEFPIKIVVGPGQQAANIRFELDPAPTAAGRVLDSFGEPIPNLMVEALRRSYDVRGKPGMTRAATTLTDDRGEYRIFWLDPGEYFFYVASPLPDASDPAPARVFPPTYFPGVGTPDEARPLRLEIGREIRIDFRLLRRVALWTVTGQTTNAMTSRSVAATITLTRPAGDPSSSRFRAQSSVTGPAPGVFSMGDVAPGSFILTATSGSGSQAITAVQRIELRPIPYVPPPLPPPEYRLSVTLSPPLSINGRLFVESNETFDLAGAVVALLSVDPDLPSPRNVSARTDGLFLLDGLWQGAYVLEISRLPQDLYLKAARFGADDILEQPLSMETRGASSPLQILLGPDGGHLQVAAYDSNGEPHPGAQLVLVPDTARRHRRDQYRVTASGEDGQSIFRGIPPGTYKLFAWEALEANAYLNSDYLRGYEAIGVPVTIRSGDNPPVSVRLIPKQ